MHPEPANLLPQEKKRSFRRGYFMRVGVVAAWILVGAIGAHSILLAPTHILLSSQIMTRASEIAAIDAEKATPEEAALESRLALLVTNANRLVTRSSTPSAVDAISKILSVSRTGVTFSSIAYIAATQAKKNPSLTLVGVAETRERLGEYKLAIQNAPSVEKVDLPIGAYTKDANLPFTITLTLKAP